MALMWWGSFQQYFNCKPRAGKVCIEGRAETDLQGVRPVAAGPVTDPQAREGMANIPCRTGREQSGRRSRTRQREGQQRLEGNNGSFVCNFYHSQHVLYFQYWLSVVTFSPHRNTVNC